MAIPCNDLLTCPMPVSVATPLVMVDGMIVVCMDSALCGHVVTGTDMHGASICAWQDHLHASCLEC